MYSPQALGVAQATSSKISIMLDSQPSCLEFSHLNPEYFVVGTYVLEADRKFVFDEGQNLEGADIPRTKQTRSGSLILFRLQGQDLSCIQTIVTPFAILDLHFSPVHKTTLAVATSEGSVCIYRLDLANTTPLLQESTLKLFDSAILVLSLAWYPVFNLALGQCSSGLAVSSSDGQVAVFDYMQYASNDQVPRVRRSQAHSLEAWTVAWSSKYREAESDFALLYSGGDDSMLCTHSSFAPPQQTDGSSGDEAQQLTEPPRRDKATHDAGVTAILPLSLCGSEEEEILLTGSYDEYVRVIAIPRSGGRTRVLAEKHLGGGVWRLTIVDSRFEAGHEIALLVLASCMHAGARLLEVLPPTDKTLWSINVIARFEEHESMNYASDGRVQSIKEEYGSSYVIVSTSFYDRKLCVWYAEHHLQGMSGSNPLAR